MTTVKRPLANGTIKQFELSEDQYRFLLEEGEEGWEKLGKTFKFAPETRKPIRENIDPRMRGRVFLVEHYDHKQAKQKAVEAKKEEASVKTTPKKS